jgi:5-formyltetrahydrofolate cyclo-ligase
MTDAQSLKHSLRAEVRARLRAMSVEAQESQSRAACETFLATDVYARAQSILLYMPLRAELDVRLVMERALADGKSVALPRFDPDMAVYNAFFVGAEPLIPGPFDILEPTQSNPAPVNRLDLIVAPGLAFDLRGRRLGRGKGFYDRLLASAKGVKCGICFEEQLLPEIPVEPHDVLLDFIATPARWQDCRGPTNPEVK